MIFLKSRIFPDIHIKKQSIFVSNFLRVMTYQEAPIQLSTAKYSVLFWIGAGVEQSYLAKYPSRQSASDWLISANDSKQRTVRMAIAYVKLHKLICFLL